ncbi:MAG: hypothetical protein L7T25_01160 [Gammaproteobacteria bacterium]|nr:hypothetical protein [Gammaproteobacteria bacterium]
MTCSNAHFSSFESSAASSDTLGFSADTSSISSFDSSLFSTVSSVDSSIASSVSIGKSSSGSLNSASSTRFNAFPEVTVAFLTFTAGDSSSVCIFRAPP